MKNFRFQTLKNEFEPKSSTKNLFKQDSVQLSWSTSWNRSQLNLVGHKQHNLHTSVIVLVRVEIILFIVVVKCSVVFWICALNAVDNTGMSQYWWAELVQSQGLLCSSPHSIGEEAGAAQGAEGTLRGQLSPADQREIPYHMGSCSVNKAGGSRRKGET